MALGKDEAVQWALTFLGEQGNTDLEFLLLTEYDSTPSDRRHKRLALFGATYLITSQSSSSGALKSIKLGNSSFDYQDQSKTWESKRDVLAKELTAAEGLTSIMPVSNLPNSYNPADSTFPDDVRIANVNDYGRR